MAGVSRDAGQTEWRRGDRDAAVDGLGARQRVGAIRDIGGEVEGACQRRGSGNGAGRGVQGQAIGQSAGHDGVRVRRNAAAGHEGRVVGHADLAGGGRGAHQVDGLRRSDDNSAIAGRRIQ